MDLVTAPEPARTTQRASAFQRWLRGPWPIVLFFFLAALFFNTRNNDLPYYYEKDAPSKVRQVVTGERNFFHPLLMLNTADVILTLSGKERTSQNAVVAGRWGMALFTAIGIAAFSMLGWRMEGRGAAVATGAFLLTFPLLFELTHIFKEDPSLICGLGLGFLAMQIFWGKRTAYQAAWMGAAAAVAISGKYVGAVAVLMAVILLLLVRRDRPERNRGRWIAFFAGLLVTLSVVNYQLVANIPTFLFGFKTEMADLTRKDKRGEVPHTDKVVRTLRRAIPPAMIYIFVAFVLHTALRRRRDPVRWMLVLYPLLFTVALAYSPRLFTRHFLPVLVMVNVVGGIGMAAVLRELVKQARLPERWQERVLLPVTLGLTVTIYIRDYHDELRNYYDVFANPTREIFIREAIYKLPADAVIASDRRVHLLDRNGNPRAYLPVSQKVLVASRLANFGSLQHLHELGVTHIAAHGIDSRYLFKRGDHGESGGADEEVDSEKPDKKKEKKEKKKKKRKFDPALYEELKDDAKLIYSLRGKGSTYHAPALRLYKLPKPPAAPAAPAASSTPEPPATPAVPSASEGPDSLRL